MVLAINYRPEIMDDFLETYADYGIKIVLSVETNPLGTAGPIGLAREHLSDGEPFFVMNCDIACDFNLRGLRLWGSSAGDSSMLAIQEEGAEEYLDYVVGLEPGSAPRGPRLAPALGVGRIPWELGCASRALLRSVARARLEVLEPRGELAPLLPEPGDLLAEPRGLLAGRVLELAQVRRLLAHRELLVHQRDDALDERYRPQSKRRSSHPRL